MKYGKALQGAACLERAQPAASTLCMICLAFGMKGSVEGSWAWKMLMCQRSSLPQAQPAAEFRG